MRYADLRWYDYSDELGQREVSQRLRYPHDNSPRVYVYRWAPNEHTIAEISPIDSGGVKWHRLLDVLDVNVRLLELEQDHRAHQRLTINDHTYPER